MTVTTRVAAVAATAALALAGAPAVASAQSAQGGTTGALSSDGLGASDGSSGSDSSTSEGSSAGESSSPVESVSASLANTGAEAALGSVQGSLDAVLDFDGLAPVVLAGGLVAAGVAFAPQIRDALTAAGIPLPPLP